MKLLRTISNKDFGHPDVDESNLRFREAARAVILDHDDNVAILSVLDGNYHKIPGGGIEEGEDVHRALSREAKEEAGVRIEIIDEVGHTLEYRDGLKQYSYCYLARLVGTKGSPEFTKKEKRDGFQPPQWLPLETAIELFKNDNPTFLRAQFMSLRDRIFLEEAKSILKI